MLDLPFRCAGKRDFRAYWVNASPPIVAVTFVVDGDIAQLNQYTYLEVRMPKPMADRFTVGEVYAFAVGPRRLE